MSFITTAEPIDGVRRLRLNRPEKLNALNRALLDDLVSAIRGTDPDCHRVIVVSGAGDAFSAGADLDEPTADGDPIDRYQAVTRAARRFDGLVVGQLHGYAIGGGLEITLGFDLRYAADGTVLRLPEVAYGYAVAAGASHLLPALVGEGRARDLILTGRELSASEAVAMGLVAETFPADVLEASVTELAADLAELPPRGVADNKRLLNGASTVEGALEFERVIHERSWAVDDGA